MRLKSIRLAGFKSFVDPTTVTFTHNMSAIVGPNGCGKSNIIDAVRWVMGESSAKYLRGESMTDVIFNGSSNRKPVSQASIELIFDNHNHALGGVYAQYAELSIKRRVTRDGDSNYFLNNQKCRRRDITDIFLGTGLGARSYAIIEQGMISRLIEARPEELRLFLEEAAGISKYKERRRETELRIRRTEENLSRLSDLRQEMDRQITRLTKQVESTKRYLTLKEQQVKWQSEIHAMHWHQLESQSSQKLNALEGICNALEAEISSQRHQESEAELLRIKLHDAHESFNAAQARFYGLSADVTRLEQSIDHLKSSKEKILANLNTQKQEQEEALKLAQNDQSALHECESEHAAFHPQWLDLQKQHLSQKEVLVAIEAQMEALQLQSHQSSQQNSAIQQEATKLQMQIQLIESQLIQLNKNQMDLKAERMLCVTQCEEEMARLTVQLENICTQQANLKFRKDQMELEQTQCFKKKSQILQLRESIIQSIASLKGQWSSVLTLIETNTHPNCNTADELAHIFSKVPAQLQQFLRVKPGWEPAFEVLLGNLLSGYACESLDHDTLLQLQKNSGFFHQFSPATPLSAPWDDLIESCPWDLSVWLNNVIPIDSIEEALKCRSSLLPQQSLLVKSGHWIGHDFMINIHSFSEEPILALHRKKIDIERSLTEIEAERETLDESLEKMTTQHEALSIHVRDIQSSLESLIQEQHQFEISIGQLKSQQAHEESRACQLDAAIQNAVEQTDQLSHQLPKARKELEQTLISLAEIHLHSEEMVKNRFDIQMQVQNQKKTAQETFQKLHHLDIQLNRIQTQKDALSTAISRSKSQIERSEMNVTQLRDELTKCDEPFEKNCEALQIALSAQVDVEQKLALARDNLQQEEVLLKSCDAQRIQAEQKANHLRAQIEKERLEIQALQIKSSAIKEQLTLSNINIEEIYTSLPSDFDANLWQTQLEKNTENINQLGPVNMAAIDELELQTERKKYLDAQNEDLSRALNTLTEVIHKIDLETRNRFKDTFNKVNQGLNTLFPKVFGGGEAYLELTGSELLDAGITIMARPPGKKNSTIHLLSGGEKALTALALVFSIFQLNPAPFCMLDEVDAPLDDANVSRYAALVKEMSQHLQFIYITHNKIAMEQADQLMGVTMHEPGCSRLVSVNVQEALALVYTPNT